MGKDLYGHIRCVVCGYPFNDPEYPHPEDCPRHAYGPPSDEPGPPPAPVPAKPPPVRAAEPPTALDAASKPSANGFHPDPAPAPAPAPDPAPRRSSRNRKGDRR